MPQSKLSRQIILRTLDGLNVVFLSQTILPFCMVVGTDYIKKSWSQFIVIYFQISFDFFLDSDKCIECCLLHIFKRYYCYFYCLFYSIIVKNIKKLFQALLSSTTFLQLIIPKMDGLVQYCKLTPSNNYTFLLCHSTCL